ncbi:MAG: O-antigen ligase family protein [Chloroflexota bacterium]
MAAHRKLALSIGLLALTCAGLALGLLVGRYPLPVAGAIAGLLGFYAIVRDPRTGVYAAVLISALLPFGVVPLPLPGVQLSFLESVLLITLFLWVTRVLCLPGQRLHLTPVGGLLLLFVGLTTVSLINGLPYGITSTNLRAYGKMVLGILLFLTVLNCLRDELDVRWLLIVLVAAGALAGIVGTLIYFLSPERAVAVLSALGPLGYPTGGEVVRYLAESDRIRAVGTSIDPNFFGALLMICVTIAATQLPATRPVVPRWLLVAALVPLLVALLLSLSRSSWMGVVAGVAFVALVRYRWLWWPLGLGALAAMLGVVPGVSAFTGHLLAGFQAQDRATLMRLGEYKDALQLIGNYPWFGVGYGSAPSVDTYVGVSSVYLLLAENAGLVGLAIYMLAVAALFVYALPPALRVGETRRGGMILSCLACIAGALVAGLFDHHYINPRVPHIVGLFWLCAALPTHLARLERERIACTEDS